MKWSVLAQEKIVTLSPFKILKNGLFLPILMIF